MRLRLSYFFIIQQWSLCDKHIIWIQTFKLQCLTAIELNATSIVFDFFFPSVKLTFISSFKFKLLAIAAVSCCRPDSDMKYILGGWLETCDDNTWSLGPCGGIAELLMLLRDKRGEKWYQVELYKFYKNYIAKLKLHILLMNVKCFYKRRCRYGFQYFDFVL